MNQNFIIWLCIISKIYIYVHRIYFAIGKWTQAICHVTSNVKNSVMKTYLFNILVGKDCYAVINLSTKTTLCSCLFIGWLCFYISFNYNLDEYVSNIATESLFKGINNLLSLDITKLTGFKHLYGFLRNEKKNYLIYALSTKLNSF